MQEQFEERWKTPRSCFGEDSQRAFDKFDACEGRLVSFTEKELNALHANTWFDGVVAQEKERRKEAAELPARQAPPAVPPVPVVDKALWDQLEPALFKAWTEHDLTAWDACVKKHPRARIDLQDLSNMVVLPLVVMHQVHQEQNTEQNTKIAALEARVTGVEDGLEARCHKGPWNGLTTYRQHNQITYDGSQWVAKEDNLNCRPGSGGPQWQLTVKHGTDGKDGRPGKDLR